MDCAPVASANPAAVIPFFIGIGVTCDGRVQRVKALFWLI
jgi:hypothetical protein